MIRFFSSGIRENRRLEILASECKGSGNGKKVPSFPGVFLIMCLEIVYHVDYRAGLLTYFYLTFCCYGKDFHFYRCKMFSF